MGALTDLQGVSVGERRFARWDPLDLAVPVSPHLAAEGLPAVSGGR